MKLYVPRETRPGERRVALVPDTVKKLSALGATVAVEEGAGEYALVDDVDYAEAGAEVIPPQHAHSALAVADAVASVRPLEPPAAASLKEGALALSFLQPRIDTDSIAAIAQAGATAMSFDLIPRISRAQSMDALTSQALVTGYRAAIVAAGMLPKFFPLFMTAAGTIPPAKVVVLGAGVAGLQAIATAKRLGAVVSAYDVRSASADEVRSMGATFIDLELEALEAGGGYAREMTEDRAARQRELLAPHIAAADALITTAAVPGRQAPLLVTASMVSEMSPGSVVVDLAAETGGNVEGSEPGEVVDCDGVQVWGGRDVASQLPAHASSLYAMNVVAVMKLAIGDGELVVDLDDDIFDGSVVVHRGEVRKGGE